MGMPVVLAYLAAFAQFLGDLGLIVGFLTRIAALGIAVDMIVAIVPEGAPFDRKQGIRFDEQYFWH